MSKGPRISPQVKEFIFTQALRHRSKPRRLLVEELKQQLENVVGQMPADETLEKLVSWARNHKPSPEDAPWTLASASEHGIPPAESVPTVLKVWKYRLATFALPLTIREAKWVALLQNVTADIGQTDYHAMCYAMRERVCEALGESFDTSDLDAIQLMSRWELATACWMGKVRSIPVSLIERVGPRPLTSADSVGLEAADAAERRELAGLIPLNLDKHGPEQTKLALMISRADPSTLLTNLNLSDEAAWVYAYWIQYLGHGPKWESLPLEKQLDTVSRLREWIRDHPWTANPPTFEGPTVIDNLQELVASPVFKPAELLEEVGYSLQSPPTPLAPLSRPVEFWKELVGI